MVKFFRLQLQLRKVAVLSRCNNDIIVPIAFNMSTYSLIGVHLYLLVIILIKSLFKSVCQISSANLSRLESQIHQLLHKQPFSVLAYCYCLLKSDNRIL